MNTKAKTFIVLGSGSTTDGFKIDINGKSFEPPMDQNFFSTPILHKIYSEEKFPALHFFRKQQRTNSLEETWSNIDICSKLTNCHDREAVFSMRSDYKKLKELFETKAGKDSKFRDNMNCQKAWVQEDGALGPLADWEARELITEIFGNLQLNGTPGLSQILLPLMEVTDLKGIASFNYDLSLENAWKTLNPTKKLAYFDPDNDRPNTDIPLYKLHGSINWKSEFSNKQASDSGWKEVIGQNINASAVEFEYIKGEFEEKKPDKIVQSMIIPPVSFKQNISLDLQTDKRSSLFKSIWHRVWEELEGVEILIFIGFSFPETDYHAKAFFSAAHRHKPFNRVIASTNTDRSLPRYHSLFGRNSVVSFTGGIQSLAHRQDEFVSILEP